MGGRREGEASPRHGARFECPPPAYTHHSLAAAAPIFPLSSSLPPCCTTLPGPSSAASDPTIVFSPVLRGTEAFLSLRQTLPSDNTTPCWQSAHVPTINDCTVLLRPRVLGHATTTPPAAAITALCCGNQRRDDLLLINYTYYLLFRLINPLAHHGARATDPSA